MGWHESAALRTDQPLQQRLVAHLSVSGFEEQLMAEAAANDPSDADQLSQLGRAAIEVGDSNAAIAFFARAIIAKPDDSAHYANLATAFAMTGRVQDALRCCRDGLSKATGPDAPDVRNTFGILYMRLGQLDLAEAQFRAAIASDQAKPEFHSNLGEILRLSGRFEESEACCREALRLRPDYPSAKLNLGNVLREQGRFHDAERCYREALDAKPNYAEALNNLGGVLTDLGRVDEAIASLRSAIQIKPDYVDAHVHLAMALLLAGRFREGWPEYEWRWRQPRNSGAAARFTKPRWDGEDIGPRVLLLHAEQGLGDTLQFCRYAPHLAAGRRVVLEAPPPLVGLLQRLPFVEQVVAQGDPLPPHDLQCPLLSLPQIFGAEPQAIPAGPYLDAEPARVDAWRKRLEPLRGLKVGLAWAGSPTLGPDRRRSLPAGRLAALADIPGIAFVSLQKDQANRDVVRTELDLHDWTAELTDFHETAALVSALDLVISVDTAVVHLAGALGRPVWLLNRFDRCWRWRLGRDDSPWYPTLKQFTQSTPGDWDEVLARVRAALLERRDPGSSVS